MSFDTSTYNEALADAASILACRLPSAERPFFYLHLGAEYDLAGFFDAPPAEIPLHELSPSLPRARTLDGEEARLLAGRIEGVPVLASAGARRVADGHGALAALFPTALASIMGVKNHIFLDTAISLVSEFKAGRWGMLADFVSDFSFSPLEGLHGMLDKPFPDLAHTLDQSQNSEILNAMADFGEPPRLCIYHGIPGFHLPTSAEAARSRAIGADFLGHDLVLHVILSHALGCHVSALVLAGVQLLPGFPRSFTRDEMRETGLFCSGQLRQGLRRAILEVRRASEGYAENILPESDADEVLCRNIKLSATRSSPLKAFLRREPPTQEPT